MTESTDPASLPVGARRQLLKSFRVLLVADLLVKALAVVTTVVIARLVGPSPLGALSLATALVAYVSVVGDGGLTTLTTRRVVEEPQRVQQLVSVTTYAQLLLSALLTLLLLLVAVTGGLPHRTAVVLLALSPLVLAQAGSLVYVLQAYDRMTAVASLRLIAQALATTLALAAVLIDRNVVWVAVASWVGLLLADGVAIALLAKQGLRPQPVTFRDVLAVLRDGRAFLGSGLLTQILTNLDIIVLGLVSTEYAVGQYGAAYRLVFTVLMLVHVLVTAVFPELVRRAQTDRAALASLLQRLIRLCARVTFLGWAAVILGNHVLIRTIYGHAFADAAVPFAILFAWVPLGYYNSLIGQGLIATGKQATYLRVISVSAAATAVALVVLAPHFGPSGAAIAVAIAETCTAVGFSLVARDLHVDGPRNFAAGLPYLVAPLSLGLVALAAGASDVLAVAVAIAVGVLVELALRVPTLQDLRTVTATVPLMS